MTHTSDQRRTLPFVNKPGRYLGLEYNSANKAWEKGSLSCALVFPDLYEIGMSHQGLQILYHLLNREEHILADRCYCPDKDMEALLREKGLPLCALESGRSLLEFDLVGITLPYELCYSNILTILDLAHIPLRAQQRSEGMPIILGGGSCGLNPEPIADFFDAVLLGDGEEAIVEIGECIRLAKKEQLPRAQILERLAAIPGVYIPSFYRPAYNEDGTIAAITPLNPEFPTVRRRVLADLSQVDHLLYPLVPNGKIVHDRLGVEIARGCTRGCRFCQAGIIYRPVRERSPEQIFAIAKQGIENSGFDELALLSLSTGDYSCLSTLLPQLMDRFSSLLVSVSMPSMRVGTLTQEVMDQIKRVRKTGFTLAPEAGSERLRRVINKGITEEDLLTTSRDAFGLGWKVMKLYFMIGLPTETAEDVDAIVELAKMTKQVGAQSGRGRIQINVSVGTFVPKPHTSFQWEKQISMAESREKISRLKAIMPGKGMKLKWHDPEQSFLEGVFSRGDRRLANLLETVWNKGARLDAWSDHFTLGLWEEAARECELSLDSFLRPRGHDEILPWQHLDSGVDTSFLLEELEKAHTETYTPDCRYHGCQQCGLCDFKEIKPIVQRPKTDEQGPEVREKSGNCPSPAANGQPEDEKHFRYTVTYSRIGNICYLGHLEILQLIFRALRRAKIRTNFSKGFNPSPKVSFGPALPVGTQSLAEFFIMDLPEPLTDLPATQARLNEQLVGGLHVEKIILSDGSVPQMFISSYRIRLEEPLTAEEENRLQQFLDTDTFSIERSRKGKTKAIDLRPLVVKLEVENQDILYLEMISKATEAGVKPLEALAAILAKEHKELLSADLIKTGWNEPKKDTQK
ncbi:MAG: TIGR03960 family B12-binding radical SAM protein [Proteobacteria bacterium]|nr:TIGR03960 family B12-binding radical SAM protein [Pseudomonadota bacterium]